MKPSWPRILHLVLAGLGLGLVLLTVLARLAHDTAPSERWWAALAAGSLCVAGGMLIGLLEPRVRPGFTLMLSQARTAWWSRQWLTEALTLPAAVLFAGAAASGQAVLELIAALVVCSVVAAALAARVMLHASRTAVPSWRSFSMNIGLILHAPMSAAVAMVALFPGPAAPFLRALALPLLFAGLLLRALHYVNVGQRQPNDIGPTLGLPPGASVRPLERTRATRNSIAQDLLYEPPALLLWQRRLTMFALAYVLPFVLLVPVPWLREATSLLATVATISCLLGLMLERWLAYAEARHLSAGWVLRRND